MQTIPYVGLLLPTLNHPWPMGVCAEYENQI